MYLDKYTNAKQLCTSKVQEFREKKNSQVKTRFLEPSLTTQSQDHYGHRNWSYAIWRIKVDNGKFHTVLPNEVTFYRC